MTASKEVTNVNVGDDLVPYNYLGRDEFSRILSGVGEHLCSILSAHCGPLAMYAAWPSYNSNGDVTDTEFSKDGISILKRLRYRDGSVQEYLREALEYFGDRVNNACHDGTTTALLFLASAFVQVSSPSFVGRPSQITKAMHQIFDEMEAALDKEKMTISTFAEYFGLDELQARSAIAYAQAMISSKGDVELATAIRDLVEKVPVERFYGQYVIDSQKYESEKRITVNEYDYDFEIPASFGYTWLNNHNFGEDYKYESVDLLAFEDWLIDPHGAAILLMKAISESINAITIEAFPEARPEDMSDDEVPVLHPLFDRDRPLVILASDVDQRLKELADKYNHLLVNLKRTGQIVFVTIPRPDMVSQRAMIKAIRALAADKTPAVGEIEIPYIRSMDQLSTLIIPDVNIHITAAGRCRLGRLYKRGDGLYVPAFENESLQSPLYTKHLNDIVEQIENQIGVHSENKASQAIFSEFLTIYRFMMCQNWVTLRLGGTTHELRATLSVVEDTFGAVTSSLEDGLIFGGVWRMFNAVRRSSSEDRTPEYFTVKNAIISAFTTILNSTYVGSGKQTIAVPETLLLEGNLHDIVDMSEDLGYHHYIDVSDAAVEIIEHQRDTLTADLEAGERRFLIQPVQGYYELIRRLREVLPGFALTHTYVPQYAHYLRERNSHG